MKKFLALLLAMLMMLTCSFGMAAETGDSAGDSADSSGAAADPEADAKAAAIEARLQSNCEFSVISADETTGQIQLSYMENTTKILEKDGLKFKDMNKNGELDAYEDWRKPVEERVADLLGQLTNEEKAGLLFCGQPGMSTAEETIAKWNLTCILYNVNGTPVTITNTLNNLQAMAEGLRLGIPMTIASDREYNSFGGYIDKAHNAFGNAYDPELAYELASFYGKAMKAVGIHVTFEPYANEIGAQYGENPDLIADIIAAEIKGLQENGLSSCTKHWIGRGGDSSFGNARSVAQNVDNWMVGWKAALVEGGSDWVMTNCGGTGLTNTVDVKWDSVTMGYLRETLGFDGVVVTDWWALGGGPNNPGRMSGITPEGEDLATKDIYWLYNRALELGTDVFGGGNMAASHDNWENNASSLYPTAMLQGLNDGTIEQKNANQAATRVLTFKFEKGLFDDPYRNVDNAVAVCASVEWAANPVAPSTNEELAAARHPDEVALTEELMAKSAVLLKNEDNLLPLEKGIKVYIDASSAAAKEGYIKYIGAYATVVEDMEEADVVIGDYGTYNDATELFIDDAIDYGKKIVLTLNGATPNLYCLENVDALLYLSYAANADHGSTEAGFVTTTAAWVYADLLFAQNGREPGGIITKEISRNDYDEEAQWADLAGDYGATPYVRLMIQATMEDDTEDHSSPNNWGDPLVQAFYGMSYGKQPEFKYSCLILPAVQAEREVEDSSGNKSMEVYSEVTAEAGKSFPVYCLLRNVGETDGITTVEVKANGEVVAKKVMTVCEGSWRVVEIDVTLEAGEYTIDVGGQTDKIVVK